jgi:uncharacterized membrane protein
MPLTTLLPDPLTALFAAALAVGVALVLHAAVFRVTKRMAQGSDSAASSRSGLVFCLIPANLPLWQNRFPLNSPGLFIT